MARSRDKNPPKRRPLHQRGAAPLPGDTSTEDERLTLDDEYVLDQIDNNILVEEELADPDRPIAERDPKKERALRKAVKEAKRTPEQSRAALRRKTRIFYDLQRLRIQTAGRTYKRANDIELHPLDLEVLELRAQDLHRAEQAALGDIRAHLSTMPAYTTILADKVRFRGIGPTLAAVILAEVDIFRCNTASALWRYAGLSVVPAQRCKNCFDPVVASKDEPGRWTHEFNRKEKCAWGRTIDKDKTFESKKAERGVKGEKLPFNRFFKTKMVGVLSTCLIKSGSSYRKVYDDYKARLIANKWGRNDGHRHQAALRYMTKMVLLDIWRDWRRLEGLDVRVPYAEEYLGKKHSAA